MNKIIDEYILHNGENLWDFEILSNLKYENINHIHPLKQQDVSKLTIDSSLASVTSELDIIFSTRLGEQLAAEIAKTGVIAYRRN